MSGGFNRDVFRDVLVGAMPHMRRYARALCRNQDQADDIVQEALLRAWEARESLSDLERCKAWAFTILRNCFLSSKIRNGIEIEDVNGDAASLVVAPDSQQAVIELNEVMSAVYSLPLAQREALLLVTVEGLSYEDASAVCDCAVGTLKSRISRAREQLTKLFGDIDMGEEASTATSARAVA